MLPQTTTKTKAFNSIHAGAAPRGVLFFGIPRAGSPPGGKQAANQTVVNGGYGGRNRSERELGEMPSGEGCAKSAVLHAHFDGNRAAEGLPAPAGQGEKVTCSEPEGVQQKHRDEKRPCGAGDFRLLRGHDATDDQDYDGGAEQWTDGVHPRADSFGVLLPKRVFAATPQVSGSMTTINIDWKSAAASTGNHAPASQWVSSGVAKMATMVEHIVSKTLSGTLALAR